MNPDQIKALKVGGILCAIGGVAAGLIGVFHLITQPVIDAAEEAAVTTGLASLYDGMASRSDVVTLEGYSYAKSYWIVYSDEAQSTPLGYAFKIVGSDSHGKLTLMCGVSGAIASPTLGRISVVKDEQTKTYATTFVANYVDKINAGSKTINDVSCGATMSATLARKMCLEAMSAYSAVSSGTAVVDQGTSSDTPTSSGSGWNSGDTSTGGSKVYAGWTDLSSFSNTEAI
jgi:hypothetical protein